MCLPRNSVFQAASNYCRIYSSYHHMWRRGYVCHTYVHTNLLKLSLTDTISIEDDPVGLESGALVELD